MSQPPLDWHSIRPLNGSRDKGFEELCAQLARTEKPMDGRFERKGTPDGGVECFVVLADGREWGWQSKYFTTLGDSQWTQLDKSVHTALEKHPALARYYVCLPLDLPDARTPGQMSAKMRWEERVKKWEGWASGRSMSVDFVYWGSSELLERLSRPEHSGRSRFWFDVRGFDGAWYAARIQEALKTAGPRYTPEIHVDLPIAADFDAFGRTEEFFARVQSCARDIREQIRPVQFATAMVTSGELEEPTAVVLAQVSETLQALGTLQPQAVGDLPFERILELLRVTEEAGENLVEKLGARERQLEKESKEREPVSTYPSNPFRDQRTQILRLLATLRRMRNELEKSTDLAEATLLVLRGAAGTGKTHLLCDVARQRLEANRPTLLLMGQRFVSLDAPWIQALQQIDMASVSAEDFIGALEASAQAAGCRALLMVDAINEGTGRSIWPSNLPAFLALCERSPWVAVVLSVRSSYEESVLPSEVRDGAVTVTHEGFAEHEYDASKTFFEHYGLELPSTPILAPEFSNPLFLKTLCKGLNALGQRRLPRGFHGITAVFDLYLQAINERLSGREALDFDPKRRLVNEALEQIAKSLGESDNRWLPRAKALEIVNGLLPGRGHERSLYRALVVEGVLIEEIGPPYGPTAEEVVLVSYERFADHLVAKILLDKHLDPTNPASSFDVGGGLAFICDRSRYISPGLFEALCIQVPERSGRELMALAPTCASGWGRAEGFRQSLVWRSYTAFSDETRDVLKQTCRSENDLNDTLDVLLTASVLPGHPLNAEFLDRRLRKDSMGERDAWWSVYLHRAWDQRGAVDRLVDWASSVDPEREVDAEATDLCGIALAWMLSTSNRFLRDRATKALVALLTGRLDAMRRLVERFADVDDPYVRERVYAAAYGVAMRSADAAGVEKLATSVHARVFAGGRPSPHILLRDYARGVVERATALGGHAFGDSTLARPPYGSDWPEIPTEEQIKPLLPDYSRGHHDGGDLEWSRNRIGSSVMNDDFGHYVIGTNSAQASREWLSVPLDEPQWRSPKERLRGFALGLAEKQRAAFERFEEEEERRLRTVSLQTMARLVRSIDKTEEDASETPQPEADLEEESAPSAVDGDRDAALRSLEGTLSDPQRLELEDILRAKAEDPSGWLVPGFDLGSIQRYILWRVFDLGWTVERFGSFDRFSIGYHGRSSRKAERIGKKYQWIAYHEILALISDHFQYREAHQDEGDRVYDGPWQIGLRDIDPSTTMRSAPGGTSWGSHAPNWWAPHRFAAWGDPGRPRDWVLSLDELPRVEELLVVNRNEDGTNWLNADGRFSWQQPVPADLRPSDVERRELWLSFTGYLVRAEEAESFLRWAEGVDFWGQWMPGTPHVHDMFLGEHSWAPASRHLEQQYYGDHGWVQPEKGCPIQVRTIAREYRCEASGCDCSLDEGYALRQPLGDVVTGLDLQWSGRGADYFDREGRVIAMDPTAHWPGPNALLLRQGPLLEYLHREGLAMCWSALGEKRVLTPGFGRAPDYPALRMSGAYLLSGDHVTGFLKQMVEERGESRSAEPRLVETVRTTENGR